jgi:hypothetical protein
MLRRILVTMKRKRILGAAFTVLAILAVGGYLAARHFLPPLLAAWVAGPDFNRLLSQAVGHALKVDGTFGTLTLGPDLSVTAEGFNSTGWPGQAIGGLDSGRATGWFDPWAVFRGRWEIDRIDIARADFRIVAPDNALKKDDPVVPPRPWYAFVMPSQFHCGWIECPDMTIELPVGQSIVRGAHLRMGAMMVGRNFKYFGRNGTLEFPGYPHLAVDALQVYVTREVIDIGYLYLREPGSTQSNLRLACRLGQQQDKSIAAEVEVTSLDLRPFLPDDIARVLAGRLYGTLRYATGPTGGDATGNGSLRVEGASLSDWDYLDRMAARSGNPALQRLSFRHVSLDYVLSGDTVTVSNLAVEGREQVDLRGGGTWDMATDTASVSLAASRIPLGAYLPATIAGGLQGELAGQVDWSWQGTQLTEGRGGGSLELSGAVLRDFSFQKFLSRFLKNRSYDDLALSRASLRWKQDEQGLRVEQIDVVAAGLAGLRGSVRVAPDGALSGTVLAGLPASSLGWLPDATTTVFARKEDGLFWATIAVSGTEKKPETDLTGQVMAQLDKHPVALADLALRGLSWWVGDALGTHSVD